MRGMHWQDKAGTPQAPEPWKFNRQWATKRAELQSQYRAMELAMGLPRRALPWELPSFNGRPMRTVGNTARCLYVRLWLFQWEGVVVLEHVADLSQGLMGIMGFRVLDQARFRQGEFPLPQSDTLVIEGRPELKLKTVQKYWNDVGFGLTAPDRMAFCEGKLALHLDQVYRAETKRALVRRRQAVLSGAGSENGEDADGDEDAPPRRKRAQPSPSAADGSAPRGLPPPPMPVVAAPLGRSGGLFDPACLLFQAAMALPRPPRPAAAFIAGGGTFGNYVPPPPIAVAALLPPPPPLPLAADEASGIAVHALLSLANSVVVPSLSSGDSARQLAMEHLDRAIAARTQQQQAKERLDRATAAYDADLRELVAAQAEYARLNGRV